MSAKNSGMTPSCGTISLLFAAQSCAIQSVVVQLYRFHVSITIAWRVSREEISVRVMPLLRIARLNQPGPSLADMTLQNIERRHGPTLCVGVRERISVQTALPYGFTGARQIIEIPFACARLNVLSRSDSNMTTMSLCGSGRETSGQKQEARIEKPRPGTDSTRP